MDKKNKPELLSPAGDFQKMKYALAFGADATYAGIPKFSLRTRELEFNKDSLIKAIDYSHKLDKKLYLTMNIFAHNTKIDSFLKELDIVAEWNPDGIIMADPGLINIAIKRYPKLTIHLSTQANATNWTAVEFWRDMGVKRIVLSRELRLKEIEEIHKRVPDVELESFVHGAICIAYSGRCLITNYLNHRDANQGTCTNSCRWEYKLSEEDGSLTDIENHQKTSFDKTTIPPDNLTVEEPQRTGEKYPINEDQHGTYLFNAKDLCAVELLKEIHNAGVCSFKIEGRTKSAYYTAVTAMAYRNAIDDMWLEKPFNKKNLNDLMALSNRGYTTGFYTRNPREFGENYYDSRSKELSHKIVGMPIDYDNQRNSLTFEIKNRLEKDTLVEVITPTERHFVTANEIINPKGQLVDVAHGGTGFFSIPLEKDPGEFVVLRREIYASEK
ncbi:MAG: U32 family peptidase C-terminal domain-containing protein [Candidatus Marinimicrobia bacterium]|nr:U32 family peptidase C-terminal domain-containing protein [Candidatus Neomarinimicrobiota bacterium]MBL7023291.1 U32 family peptidase C-terminal domain-containing protein [Candidatus Neomarinimicrobiota bacterium]